MDNFRRHCLDWKTFYCSLLDSWICHRWTPAIDSALVNVWIVSYSEAAWSLWSVRLLFSCPISISHGSNQWWWRRCNTGAKKKRKENQWKINSSGQAVHADTWNWESIFPIENMWQRQRHTNNWESSHCFPWNQSSNVAMFSLSPRCFPIESAYSQFYVRRAFTFNPYAHTHSRMQATNRLIIR